MAILDQWSNGHQIEGGIEFQKDKMNKWKFTLLFRKTWIMEDLGKGFKYLASWGKIYCILIIPVVFLYFVYPLLPIVLLMGLSITHLCFMQNLNNLLGVIPEHNKIRSLSQMEHYILVSMIYGIISLIFLLCSSMILFLNLSILFIIFMLIFSWTFARLADESDIKTFKAFEAFLDLLGIIPVHSKKNLLIEQSITNCIQAKKRMWIPVIGIIFFERFHNLIDEIGNILSKFDELEYAVQCSEDNDRKTRHIEKDEIQPLLTISFCPYCGGDVVRQDSCFCIYCGHTLRD